MIVVLFNKEMNMSITLQITTTTYTDKIKIGTPPHKYIHRKILKMKMMP